MSRFQIEDIVEQDKHGVVFRALDKESGRTVSLRRFLPFGQDGGGLEKDEAAAFRTAAERISDISHASLRSVITGSVDPIDGIPYLVTEWVDGMSLTEILGGERMDPALVTDVLRIALEASIALSEVLGEEAVWVETEMQSIIIGTEESGRGFTFWISPFKWLGAEFGTRKLSSIVELGEELAGWKGRLVSDQAGNGLGGWLKWLKKNPDARLGEALEMLPSSASTDAPHPEAELISHAATPQFTQAAPASRGKLLVLVALVLLVAAAATILFLNRSAKPAPVAGTQEAAKSLNAAERASARAQELRLEANAPAKGTPAKPASAEPAYAPGKVFTPDDRNLWTNMKQGAPVKLSGTLRSVKLSSTGKSIYLFLSDPPDAGRLAGVIHKSSFKGDFRTEAFTALVGKKLLLDGACFKEPGGRFLAKVTDRSHIQEVK